MTELIIELWTDGSCNNKTGLGAYAFAGTVKPHGTDKSSVVYQEAKSYHGTTSNRMEMLAAIKGLEWARNSAPEFAVIHYSDSQYLLNIPTWAKKWRVNGWKTANKKQVKNKDLVKKLLEEVELTDEYASVWVPGHAGVIMNEHVDQLATLAVQEMKPIEDVRSGEPTQLSIADAVNKGLF